MTTINLQYVPRLMLAGAVAIMVACSWFAPFDSAANQQIDSGLKRALLFYATARGINGALSVIQGTEVTIDPSAAGFKAGGIKLALGQRLHAVNDLVERFAHLMLVASIALGIEKILMSIGAHWMISAALTIVAIVWGYLYLRRISTPAWLLRVMVILLMTRFAMPIAIIGSETFFQNIIAADYAASQGVMKLTSEQITSLNATVVDNPGFWSKVKTFGTEFNMHLSNLMMAVERAIEHAIKLMAIFVVQIFILPILILWALWGVARGTFEVPSEARRVLFGRKQTETPQPQ